VLRQGITEKMRRLDEYQYPGDRGLFSTQEE